MKPINQGSQQSRQAGKWKSEIQSSSRQNQFANSLCRLDVTNRFKVHQRGWVHADLQPKEFRVCWVSRVSGLKFTRPGNPGPIGVLFGCFGRKIDGPGLPGGLIIYQGHLFPLKGHPCQAPCLEGRKPMGPPYLHLQKWPVAMNPAHFVVHELDSSNGFVAKCTMSFYLLLLGFGLMVKMGVSHLHSSKSKHSPNSRFDLFLNGFRFA